MRRVLKFSIVCLLSCAWAHAGDVLDRVVATVNGQAIMQSDVQEEGAFECLQSAAPCSPNSEELQHAALQRLIDRKLITEQMRGAKFERSRPEEVQRKIDELRRQLLADSKAANDWNALLGKFRISEEELRAHIAAELDAMRFLDAHFRPGTVVTSDQVAKYYREQLLPKLPPHSKPPELSAVSPKIREVLVQENINTELDSWLMGLHEQSSIEIHE